MTNRNMALFRAAQIASLSSDHRCRLGAVVYNKHRIISAGCNSQTDTDPIQAALDHERYGCCCPGKLHAESAALIPLIKRKIDISGADLYIYRSKRDGTLGMARPCQSCMKLIKQCGIKRIFYTTDDGYAEEVISYS